MKNEIYVIGHKNPDTDSICSAIAYSELKKKFGINAIPKRLGDISRETQFILQNFDVQIPDVLYTVKTQVSDLNMDQVNSVCQDTSIKIVWELMKRNNIKTVPVVDKHDRLLGIVTLSDLTNKYMDALDSNSIASTMTSLRSIVDTLNGELLCGSQESFNTSGRVVVAAAEADELKNFIETGDIVITANRSDSQIKSIEYGASCLIITCGKKPEKAVIDEALQKGCMVIITPMDTFTTARLINQSIPVGSVMSIENIIKFKEDDFIDDIREKMLKTRYRSYPVVDESNRVKGFISRYHLISHNKKKVILMDHNEKSQTVDGIEEADILEIIDHHRLGDIQTANPIFVKNEPVGSTAAIIANIYFDKGIRPSKRIAGILCAAILSDTIGFKSPTCTYTDRITAEKLAEMAGIENIGEFALLIFKKGSSIEGKTVEDILKQDFKEYYLGKRRIGIGQVFSTDNEKFDEIREEVIIYMTKLCEEKEYNLLVLFLTDVPNQGSETLFVGEDKDLMSKAFSVSIGENSVYLPGIVSRKKQVVPQISEAIERS